ncbi:hypothetical protein E4U42_006700 [Claviceps africana]|uniref:DNA-binding protein RAP1 n=1 Tax=Claviceps africana TaxID=83212 RepID=A0A8K0J2P5_9HYPO|nr:hypothetical protein E4U42_006700 [Claviceps africana]
MADGVKHDGAHTATRGIIFKDMVFWVALRRNGGRVVPQEKDAQVLIADHARKDAPLHSVSWKYITDSVANGCAQLTDRYCLRPRASAEISGGAKLTRSGFTNAEDAALANWVLSHSRDRTGNEIYKKFAESHPSHPWQSWRNRFVKVLSNRPTSELNKLAMSAADLAVKSTATSQRGSKPATPRSMSRTTGKQPPAASAASQTRPPAAQPTIPQRHSTVSPPARASAARAIIDPASAEEARQEPSLSHEFSSGQSEELGVETQVNMRDRFYHDLWIYVEVSGVPVNPEPEFRGKCLDLWHLSQAVESQKVPPQEVDWRKVAEDLQYDWRQDAQLVDDLRGCFEENLASFFEAISGYVSDDEDAPEQGDIESQSSLHSPLRDRWFSTPVGSRGRKRRLEDEPSSPNENPARRGCLGRAVEIPATPENRLGISSTRSPTLAKTKQQQHEEDEDEDEDEDDDDDDDEEEDDDDDDDDDDDEEEGEGGEGEEEEKKDEMSEDFLPETHANSTPLPGSQRSNLDATPSQQLLADALETKPIPLNLGDSRSVDRPHRPSHAEPLEQQSADKAKATSRVIRRSLPASFRGTKTQRWTAQELDTRAQQPARPVRAGTAEQGQSQGIRKCIEYYEGLGYARHVVVESLNRTSLRPGWPATLLMERLQQKEEVPSNVEGIWTDRDDGWLHYADSVRAREATATPREKGRANKKLERLVNKHTQEEVDLRRRFFAAGARIS